MHQVESSGDMIESLGARFCRWVVPLAVVGLACTPTKVDPPVSATSPRASAALSPEPTEPSTKPAPPAPVVSADDVSADAAVAPEPPKPPPPPDEPALVAEDGSLLPQTEHRPTTDTPIYAHHVELLFKAIVEDDPEIARPFFFPLVAYEQVKAIEKPAWDWNHRLWKHFERDVHEYHAKLGANPEGAVLERIALREPSIRWMKPHTEGNRLGYFRVTRSRIQGRKADGTPIDLELTSMISWRGEWYVVHLHGFQ